MPFYNIFADWPYPVDEVQQFVRLQVAMDRVFAGTEHIIVGITHLSTRRARLTFQTEEPAMAEDLERIVAVGASRIVFSQIRLGDSGFPLLDVGAEFGVQRK